MNRMPRPTTWLALALCALAPTGALAQDAAPSQPPATEQPAEAENAEGVEPAETVQEAASEGSEDTAAPSEPSEPSPDAEMEVSAPEPQAEGSGSDAPPTAAEPAAPPVPSAEAPLAQPFDLSKYQANDGIQAPKVRLGAFADFSLNLTDNLQQRDLALGEFVVHSTAMISPHLSTFAELGVQPEGTPSAKLHRLLFRWEASDHFGLTLGRYHLPLTWWNFTFHHGTWLQTSAARPGFLTYLGALVPNHAEGGFVTGLVPGTHGLGLRYNVAVIAGGHDHEQAMMGTQPATGSGMATTMDPSEHAGHSDNVPTGVNVTLAAEPQGIPLLRVGVSGLYNPGHAEHLVGSKAAAAAHVAYTSERPEIIVEGLAVSNTTVDAAGRETPHQSVAGYAQAAYRLHGAAERLKPYLRYEQSVVDDTDPALSFDDTYLLVLSGLRVDVHPNWALKFEANHRIQETDSQWGGIAQVSAAW